MAVKNNDQAIEFVWAMMTTISNDLNRKIDQSGLVGGIGEVAEIVGDLQLAFEEVYMGTETFAANPQLEIRPELKIEIRRFFSFLSESNEDAHNEIEYAANTAKALRKFLASGPSAGPFAQQIEKHVSRAAARLSKLSKSAKGYRASDSVTREKYAEIRKSVEAEVQKAFEARLGRSIDRVHRLVNARSAAVKG